MKAVVRERKIPFEIRAENIESVRKEAMNAFDAMRLSLAESGIPEMSLDEINAEIKAVRDEKREKNLRGH